MNPLLFITAEEMWVTSPNNALTLLYGGSEQGAGALGSSSYCSKEGHGNHTPSPGAKLRRGTGSVVLRVRNR